MPETVPDTRPETRPETELAAGPDGVGAVAPRLRINPTRCTWRSLGAQIVVLDLTGSVYFELNHTAALLWPALVDGTDEPTLTGLLAAAGAANTADGSGAAADVTADLRTFLDELAAAGLLEPQRTGT